MSSPSGKEPRAPLEYRLLERWMRVIAVLVPRYARAAWLAEWDGELWYGVAGRRRTGPWSHGVGLAIGMLRDAAHLRLAPPLRRRPSPPGDGWFRSSISDVRHSLRSLRKAPEFTAVVLITLGLGIGAATAIFSVVNALLLNPLPYPDSDRLVIMWQGRRASSMDQDWFSPVHFAEIRDHVDAFEALALTYGSSFTMTGRGPASRLGYVMATSSYLRMLGASAAVGRLLDEGDDRGDAATVALLTHALWQRSFGADPEIVGRTVTLGSTDIEIVGVLSPDVLLDNEVLPTEGGIGRVDVVLSLRPAEELRLARGRVVGPRGGEDYNIIGKLRPGASLTQAQADLDVAAANIQRRYEDDPNSGFFIRAVPLLDQVVGGVRRPLLVLLGSVGALLLIACVNAANLLLARATSRRRELGIRAAVGATRGRLVRTVFSESALLAAGGGGLGAGLAAAGIAAVHRFGAASLPRISEIAIDGRVLGVAIALTAATCVLFGLLPAWRASRVDPAGVMKAAGWRPVGGGTLGPRFNLASALVIAQVGLSLLLLIGGGLLTRSFVALREVDPGFQPGHLLTFRVQLSAEYRRPTQRLAFYDRLMERLCALPGVEAAAGVSRLPFADGIAWGFWDVQDYTPPQGADHHILADFGAATPAYFKAMGIPLVRGRGFDERDRADGELVALIDEHLASTYFPDRDPIGMRLVGWSRKPRTIVGVTGTVKHYTLEQEPRVTIYYPVRQLTLSGMYIVVRTTGDPEALVAAAMRVVRELDDQVVVVSVASMPSRLAASLAKRRFVMVLLQAFSALALILAVVGVYGVVSYRVHRGARELGVRVALGASTRSVCSLVLRHALVLASLGIALGLAAALAVTRFLRSMLFGVAAVDATTFAALAAALLATTLIASYLPARRAAMADPLAAIKSE